MVTYKTCEYIISATSKKQFPNKDNLNEYVFVGRSNVGKSSLIKAICSRKMLAYTSSKPGKTITINFYLIDKRFYLVDVPGYGYAIKAKQMQINFGEYVERYLNNNINLKYAFLLCDSKVGPTKDDVMMYEYFKYYNIETKVIGTKCDRFSKAQIEKQKKLIADTLKCDKEDIIMTSSTSKLGIDTIQDLLN